MIFNFIWVSAAPSSRPRSASARRASVLAALVVATFAATVTSASSARPANPALASAANAAAPSAPFDGVERVELVMGTLARIAIDRPDARPARFEAAFAALRDVDAAMSLYRASSELRRLNARAATRPEPVGAEMFALLARARALAAATDGAFDVTVLPLLRAWGAYRDLDLAPTNPAAVGYAGLVLDGERRTVAFRERGMGVDLGGVAKGYALDRAAAALATAGVRRALLDLGGNLAFVGDEAGRAWRVAVRDPAAPDRSLGVLELGGGAVSTSANYARDFAAEGWRAPSHIYDPRTAASGRRRARGDRLGARRDDRRRALDRAHGARALARRRGAGAGSGIRRRDRRARRRRPHGDAARRAAARLGARARRRVRGDRRRSAFAVRARRCVVLAASLAVVLTATAPSAKVFLAKDEALALAFPGADRVEERVFILTDAQKAEVEKLARARLDTQLWTIHVGWRGGAPVGYAVIDTHVVRTLPETCMVVISPAGEVERVEILAFNEPPEYAPTERWLHQFDGKELDEGLKMRGDVQGITGATLTATATIAAVRRALALHTVLIRSAAAVASPAVPEPPGAAPAGAATTRGDEPPPERAP